jgi:peptide/nickel transport system permease protein
VLYRNEVLTISAYIIRRLLQAVLIVIIVTFLVFFLVYQLPGDPVEMLISANMTQDVTPELIEQLRHEKGLDRPILLSC